MPKRSISELDWGDSPSHCPQSKIQVGTREINQGICSDSNMKAVYSKTFLIFSLFSLWWMAIQVCLSYFKFQEGHWIFYFKVQRPNQINWKIHNQYLLNQQQICQSILKPLSLQTDGSHPKQKDSPQVPSQLPPYPAIACHVLPLASVP